MNIYLIALSFNCLDFISGFIAGVKNEGVQSKKMREGLFNKAGFVLLYMLAFLIEYSQKYLELPFTRELSIVLVVYVIVMEVVSIIENIAKVNSDLLPEQIKKIIGIKGSDKA